MNESKPSMGENFKEHTKVATDMEFAISLIGHIRNPCKDLEGNNIRSFYIREVERALSEDKIKDPLALEMLKQTLQEYPEEK